jgi:Tfp pilus assembly protein FimT
MSQKGYSIVEFLVGFLVIATICVFTMPSLVRAEQTYKLIGAANDVQSRLQSARIQAVNRNADHRIRVVSSLNYVLERRSGGSWVLQETYAMRNGYSISATGPAEFHSRGNANPVANFTITNPRSETRQVDVETSGYVHAQ